MLKIKLLRTGKKHNPSYRIVVGERAHVSEVLGSFKPTVTPPYIEVDKKKVDYWVGRGAKISEPVEKLLKGKYEYKPYIPKKIVQEEPRTKPPEEKSSKTPVKESPESGIQENDEKAS